MDPDLSLKNTAGVFSQFLRWRPNPFQLEGSSLCLELPCHLLYWADACMWASGGYSPGRLCTTCQPRGVSVPYLMSKHLNSYGHFISFFVDLFIVLSQQYSVSSMMVEIFSCWFSKRQWSSVHTCLMCAPSCFGVFVCRNPMDYIA